MRRSVGKAPPGVSGPEQVGSLWTQGSLQELPETHRPQGLDSLLGSRTLPGEVRLSLPRVREPGLDQGNVVCQAAPPIRSLLLELKALVLGDLASGLNDGHLHCPRLFGRPEHAGSSGCPPASE